MARRIQTVKTDCYFSQHYDFVHLSWNANRSTNPGSPGRRASSLGNYPDFRVGSYGLLHQLDIYRSKDWLS